jgi:hypothetical protein
MHLRIALCFLVLSCWPFGVILAQLPTAAVSGVVRDSSAAAIPGAQVTATNRDTGFARSTQSSNDGRYRLVALPVGTYDVKAEASAFRAELQQALRLEVAQEAVLNFTLGVGAVQETVTVSAEAQLVETTSGSLGGVVSEEKVAELPLNGRNFNQLVFLQPGITAYRTNSATSTLAVGLLYSSNGAPIRSNAIMLDGASVMAASGVTGVSVTGSMMGVEGVREFRVITNSFPAEYGMSMGSQTTIVTKSGTNQFHGSLFEFLRNSAIDARNFFDRKVSPASPRLPAFRRNNFGGSIGGPIRKDRMFFFATYEGLRERLGLTQALNVPTAAVRQDGFLVPVVSSSVKPYLNLYPLPTESLPTDPTGATGVARFSYIFSQSTREDFGQGRWDLNLSEKDSTFFRYTISDVERNNPAGFPQFVDAALSRGQFMTLAENHTFTPNVLNMFRLSYSRPVQTYVSPSDPALGFQPGLQMGSIAPGSGITSLGPVTTRPSANRINLYTLSDDVLLNRGQHAVKFGALINRYHFYHLSSSNNRGQYAFANLRDFLTNVPQQFTIQTPGSVPDRTYRWNTLGFYLQDDWRVRTNFTLNLGIRYEFLTTVNETKGHGASLRDIINGSTITLEPALFDNPSLKNFSPRLGFAWDVFGGGTTALRGGFGLLYDVASFITGSQLTTSGNPPYSSSNNITTNVVFPFMPLPPGILGKALRFLDYNLQQPHLMQYNLTVERKLPYNSVVSATYAGSRGINLYNPTEGNPTWPSGVVDGRLFWTGNEPRRNPSWDTIDMVTAASDSWYNSLQLMVKKQLSSGLQFQSSYTWSKSLDTMQGQAPGEFGGGGYTVDPDRHKTEKGYSDFDTQHSWNFNALYQLPNPNLNGVSQAVLNGWKLASILSVRSGLPFTPVLSANRSRTKVRGNNPDRPDRVAERTPDDIILGGPDRYFDPLAFTIQPAGFLGTSGRNDLQGPGMVNLDLSISKEVPLQLLGEGGRLDFRAEAFNVFNRANFNIPNAGRTVYTATATAANPVPLATAGQIDRTVTSSRNLQFALKLLF